MVWQALLGAIIAGGCLVLVIALARRPDGGWNCEWCDKLACTDFLGWSCAYAIPPTGSSCEYFIFPNSTVSVECPRGGAVFVPDFAGSTDADFSALCLSECLALSLPAPPPPSIQPPSDSSPPSGIGGVLQ